MWSTPADAERTLAILEQHGRVVQRIGTAVSDPQKIVRITARGLAGQHKRFCRDDRAARGDGVERACARLGVNPLRWAREKCCTGA